MIVIELPQRIFVGAQLVLIVNVLAGQEGKRAGFLGQDHRLQTTIAIGLVTDEIDVGDLRAITFVDDEGEVHAPLPHRNDLRRDLDVATTNGRVGFAQTLDVGVDELLVVWSKRLRLNDSRQLVVLDLAVAVEDDLVDELVFADRHDKRASGNRDADVGEIACGIEPLHRFIDVDIGEGDAGTDRQVGAHRLFTSTFSPPNLHIANDGRLCDGCGSQNRDASP